MEHRHASGLDHSAWRALAWIGVVLMNAALVVVWTAEQWNGAWTIGLFLGISIVFLLMRDKLPSVFGFLVVFASLVNAGGWALGWFHVFFWFDEFVHTFTAFAGLSAIGYLHAQRQPALAQPGRSKLIWWCAGLGLLLGIGWEIAEALFINLAPVDTILDLAADTVGAALGGLFARWAAKRNAPVLHQGRPAREW